MKKVLILTLVCVCTPASMVFSADDLMYELGKKVEALTLKDIEGNAFALDKVLEVDGVKGVVLVFISPKCPASVRNDARYIKYAQAFKEKGVLFLAISSNFTDSIDDLKAHATKNNYNFPVLKDTDNIIADRFAARTTPHAFFIDKHGVLRYHGRIDDNLYDAEKVQEATLANVVNDYLAGKELSVTQTKPGG